MQGHAELSQPLSLPHSLVHCHPPLTAGTAPWATASRWWWPTRATWCAAHAGHAGHAALCTLCTLCCSCGASSPPLTAGPLHALEHAPAFDPQAEQREVSTEAGVAFARAHGCLYVETSAKGNVAVEQAFEELVLKVSSRLSCLLLLPRLCWPSCCCHRWERPPLTPRLPPLPPLHTRTRSSRRPRCWPPPAARLGSRPSSQRRPPPAAADS